MTQSTSTSRPALAPFSTLRQQISVGRLARSVLVVGSGHMAGYVVLAGTMPLLTRCYSPAAFGVLATYGSMMSLIGTAICGRYEAAIPLPKHRDEAQQLAWSALTIATVGSLLAWVALHHTFAALPSHWDIAKLSPYLPALSANLLMYGLFQILTFSMTRNQDFRGLAIARCWLVVFTVTPQLAWGLIGAGPTGLIMGQFAGYAVAALILLYRSPQTFGSRPKVHQAASLMACHWRFPVFATLSDILNISLTVLPPLLITAIYGLETAGAFLLAWRMVGAPITLLVVPVGRIYCSESSKYARESPEKLPQLFRRTLVKCSLIAVLPMTVLAAVAPTFFPWLFGPEWKKAGLFCSCLAAPLLCHLLAISVRSTFAATNRQDLQLATSFIGTALANGILALTGWLGYSPLVAIACFSAAASFAYLLTVVGCQWAIRSWRAEPPTRIDHLASKEAA